MGTRQDRSTLDPESGMTLVELVVVIVVSTLLVLGLSGLFAQGWLAQAFTVEEDAAVGDAHVTAMRFETMMRSTRKAVVSADGTSLAAEVHVDDHWVCQTLSPAGTRFGPAGSTVVFGGRVTYEITLSGDLGSSVDASGSALLQGQGSGGATC